MLPIYKTVEKIVAVVRKVVVSMDDSEFFFCSFSYSVQREWAVVQWVGHGYFKLEVLSWITGGERWCQEGHPTSNAPEPY